MKILLLGLNFSPELTGIGKYTGEMAFWLASQGHDVRVITTPPYYPAWSIGSGYSGSSYKVETIQGVTVYRCPLWVPAKPTGVKRILHLLSFALSSLPVLLLQLRFKPDVIWTVQPAFFGVPCALLFSKLARCATWLHIQDFELDAAFDLGLLKGEKLKRLVCWVESRVMHGFDRVSSISRRMVEKAASKGVAADRRVLFPNWVDVNAVYPLPSSSYRAALGIAEDECVALYSGNMGTKQGLELLADAARLCSEKNIRFVFCGNGAGRAGLEQACAGLGNVIFLDLQPLEQLNDLLSLSDIHLLPQRADAADLVMPSKLTGMLASGRPVVATAHAGTELAVAVQGCGVVVEPGNADAFAQAILDLAEKPELRATLGKQARAYAEANLSRDAVLQRFEAELHALVQKKHAFA